VAGACTCSQHYGSDNNTALHLACMRGHTAAACLLVDAGEDVCAANAHGWSPLHLAVLGNHGDTLTALLRASIAGGAPRNPAALARLPLLQFATVHSKLDAVRALGALGASPLAADVNGWTAMDIARFLGRLDTLPLLSRIIEAHKGGGSPAEAAHAAWLAPMSMAKSARDAGSSVSRTCVTPRMPLPALKAGQWEVYVALGHVAATPTAVPEPAVSLIDDASTRIAQAVAEADGTSSSTRGARLSTVPVHVSVAGGPGRGVLASGSDDARRYSCHTLVSPDAAYRWSVPEGTDLIYYEHGVFTAADRSSWMRFPLSNPLDFHLRLDVRMPTTLDVQQGVTVDSVATCRVAASLGVEAAHSAYLGSAYLIPSIMLSTHSAGSVSNGALAGMDSVAANVCAPLRLSGQLILPLMRAGVESADAYSAPGLPCVVGAVALRYLCVQGYQAPLVHT
ncbi:MAG: ankyrin repeat domain-containing protein, partial [Methanobacteriota archaeon]